LESSQAVRHKVLVLASGVRPVIRQGATSDDVANPIIFMFYVYILLLNNKQIYTGFTDDLKRRMNEHKRGKVKFTSQRLPIKIIHYEAYLLKTDAQRRERYLKTTEGKRFLKQQLKELLIMLNIGE
jgi:putative endonuclease